MVPAVLRFSDIHTDIHFDTQTVVIDGVEHKVRNKTFALLRRLIDAEGELVAKDVLLREIWDDVVVDEQVVFQSVKELRKLFPGQTAIRTVPRKGYAWVPKATPENATTTAQDGIVGRRWPMPSAFAIVVAVCLMLVVSVTTFWSSSATDVVSGSVVVLPVHSDIPSNDLVWTRYGLMDQVIARLSSTEQAGVLQTDYVLEVMARASVTPKDILEENIAAIFSVSGAELVVAMRLTGQPNDYQLLYTLYQRDGVQRGAVLDDSLQDAADKVASVIGQRLAPDFSVSSQSYESAFSGHLIAEALEAKTAGNNEAASELLEAARVASPDNLAVSRLLVQTMVENNAPLEDVRKIAEPGILKASQAKNNIDQIRLEFWLAMSELTHGNTDSGMRRLDEVETLAHQTHDWLYLAYVEEIRGQYQQSQAAFSQAYSHYQQALEYHAVLHCPLGKSNTLMHLSRLAYAQQDKPLAIERGQNALDIIRSRNLSGKRAAAESWLDTLSGTAEK